MLQPCREKIRKEILLRVVAVILAETQEELMFGKEEADDDKDVELRAYNKRISSVVMLFN